MVCSQDGIRASASRVPRVRQRNSSSFPQGTDSGCFQELSLGSFICWGFFYYFFHLFLNHHVVSFLLLTPLVGQTLGGRGPRGSASLVRALFSPLLCHFTPCTRKSPRALPFPGISGIWFLQIVRYGDVEVQAPQRVPWQEMALLKEFCKLWLHLQLLASCPC